MKIKEITEGLWDVMRGAMNPNSYKNLQGARTGDYDAAGNPTYHGKPASASAAMNTAWETQAKMQANKSHEDEVAKITSNQIDPRTYDASKRAAIDDANRKRGKAPIDWSTITANYFNKRMGDYGEQINSLQVEPTAVDPAHRTHIDALRAAQGKPPIDWSERQRAYDAMKATP